MKRLFFLVYTLIIANTCFSNKTQKFLMVSLYTKQDVGYILIEECSITDNEFKTYLSNESDFTSKLMFYLKSDSIFLIQELYNFLRFTLPDLGIHHFNYYELNKFYLKDIDKIVVVDVIQFWPGEVVISESGPTDNFSPEHSSELIYLCNFNNHYYHLFNFTGSTLNESFKNNLINKIQKDKINTDEFQQYLLDKKQVLYSAFNK